MDLLSKFSFTKKESQAWAVVLKGIPDKKSEENLIHIFTERLNIPGDDALRIVRSSPIILFDERNSREAEQIKLALNQTGVRTSISNDVNELKKLPRVVWPRKVEAPELHIPRVPPPSLPQPSLKSSKPMAVPPEPRPRPVPLAAAERFAPPPPPPLPPPVPSAPPQPVTDEWKIKYQNLQESYLSAMDRLKKREAELKAALERGKKLEQDSTSLYSQLERFRKERIEEKVSELEIKLRVTAEERELAAAERDEARRRLERNEHETQELRSSRSLLEKERETLKAERDEALLARQQAERVTESLRREITQTADIQDALRRQVQSLQGDKEKLVLEIEKVKVDLESYFDSLRSQSEVVGAQLSRVERVLEALKGTAKPKPAATASAPETPKPQSRALHIGIAPPPPSES